MISFYDLLDDDPIAVSFRIICEANALKFYDSNKKFEMKKNYNYESNISISLRPLSVVVVSSCFVYSATTLPTAVSAVENKGFQNTSKNKRISTNSREKQRKRENQNPSKKESISNVLSNLGALFIASLITLIEAQKKVKKREKQIIITQAFFQAKLPKPVLIKYFTDFLTRIYPSIPVEKKIFISLALFSFLVDEISKKIHRNQLSILKGGDEPLNNRNEDLIYGKKIDSLTILLRRLLLQLFLCSLLLLALYFVNAMGEYWITAYVKAETSKEGFFLEYFESADAVENFSLRAVLIVADLKRFFVFTLKFLLSSHFLVILKNAFLILKNIRNTYSHRIRKQPFTKPFFLTKTQEIRLLFFGFFLIYSFGFSSLARNSFILMGALKKK